jgi:hypothetical protein
MGRPNLSQKKTISDSTIPPGIGGGRQAAGGRPGRSPVTAAITVAYLSPDQSRPGAEQKVQVGNITPPELFAGGFVDFLLGRGARHPK